MMRSMISALVLSAVLAGQASPQLNPPATWKVRSDAPAGDKTLYYVEMPPGWHITTGPATFFFDPSYTTSGRFALEAEIFLFPGTSQEGYGLFAGGQRLETADEPRYVAFLLRRDGGAAIEARAGGPARQVRAWQRHDAVAPHTGGDRPVRNVIRVIAEAEELSFEVNGQNVATVPRADLALDGVFGFRVGTDVNLHASRLDVTRLLAPAPRKP